MDHEIRARLKWVKLYRRIGNAGFVCRRCGISRPTLRKWLRRYERNGISGLRSRNKRPRHSPAKKIFSQQERWILELRHERKLGVRRIQNELKRLHGFDVSLAAIHKVLKRHRVPLLVRKRRKQKVTRYEKSVPGEQIQMDTCKIGPGLYQYLAIDDCTRYVVSALFPRRTASNSLHFLEQVIEEMPFPIQRIQTDRGREFFAYEVQDQLKQLCIKFRPIRPGSPHLNGKVERAHRTTLDEFYAVVSIDREDLHAQLAEWQHYYNWLRIHGSIGSTPMDKFFALIDETPYWQDVQEAYEPSKERIRDPIFAIDQLIRD